SRVVRLLTDVATVDGEERYLLVAWRGVDLDADCIQHRFEGGEVIRSNPSPACLHGDRSIEKPSIDQPEAQCLRHHAADGGLSRTSRAIDRDDHRCRGSGYRGLELRDFRAAQLPNRAFFEVAE